MVGHGGIDLIGGERGGVIVGRCECGVEVGERTRCNDRFDPAIDIEAGAQQTAGFIGGEPIELIQVHGDLLDMR